MAGKRIFYVTSNDLTAVFCEENKIQQLGVYAADPEGFEAFGKYLEQEPDYPSAFLVDVIEEEFRLDTIPHVIGLDRSKLLDRKAAGQFRSTPFRSATIAGREKSGRKDDRVLFSGLTKPEAFEPWLSELRQRKVPLMGVYSVPQVMLQVAKSLKVKHANMLILSIQKNRLLRQTFFNNGELKISRLTPMSSTSVDAYINSIQNEVERNQRYLGRLQLLAFTEPMHVYLLSEGELIEAYANVCVGNDKLYFHSIDANSMAEKSGLKDARLSGRNEDLFSYLLSKKLPEGNYASKNECAYFSFYKLRRQVVAASVFLAVGATAWSVNNVFEGQKLKLQADEIAMQTQKIRVEYEKQAARMPEVPYKPRVMRAAVESDDALAKRKPAPMQALVLIGQGLIKHPNIELDEISWNSVGEPVEVTDDMLDENGEVIPELAASSGGSATIRARLKEFPKNYQMAFKQIEAFIETLEQNQHIREVNAITLPLNTDPEKSLVGESQRLAEKPSASFELELVVQERDREA